MSEIVYEISNADYTSLKSYYGFDIGYLDEDGVYKLSKSTLDKWNSIGILNNIEEVCISLLTKTFDQVFIDDSIRNFIANDSKEIDFSASFSKYYVFNLTGNAVVDSKGDVVEVEYKNPQGELAVKEYRTYDRQQIGQIPREEYIIKKNITVRYYKKDGTYIENILPEQTMNEYERKKIDKKARANVIDRVREETGQFIITYITNKVIAGEVAPEDAEAVIFSTATEALTMLEALNDQISAYRDDRQTEPLVVSLDSYPRTVLLTEDIINYIKTNINIQYYTT